MAEQAASKAAGIDIHDNDDKTATPTSGTGLSKAAGIDIHDNDDKLPHLLQAQDLQIFNI
jgi:hypothetical protein